MKPLLIVIGGPTASGKTQIALSLAKKLNTVILSADSRQVYRGMNIGTAKISPADQQGVKHYLLDCCNPNELYNAGKFSHDALEILKTLFRSYPAVILCGGTGLFIKGVVEGFAEVPNVPDTIRQQLNNELTKNGLTNLASELSQVDHETFSKIDCQNPRRVLRALEVFRATGKPLSFYQQQQPVAPDFNVVYCVLSLEKDTLHARIKARVHEMLSNGLVKETQDLLQKGYSPELQSMQTLGYKECILFIEKKIAQSELADLIILRTKQYAKRQLTWFKKVTKAHWIPADNLELATGLILQLIHNQLEDS